MDPTRVPSALIVVAHPRRDSFVHALADEAASALRHRGHDIVTHDLYADGFDPVLDPLDVTTTRPAGPAAYTAGADALTTRYRRDLAAAHTLVVAHPNWWGKPPAIMAGWMDRVLAPGVAYEFDEAHGDATCLLPLRHLLVLNTGDTPLDRETDVFGDPLSAIWERCVGAYLGDARISRLLATPLGGSSEGDRRAWLARAHGLAAAE